MEHNENFKNRPRYREVEKDRVLDEERSLKLNHLYDLLAAYDGAPDPQTLKKMFIY